MFKVVFLVQLSQPYSSPSMPIKTKFPTLGSDPTLRGARSPGLTCLVCESSTPASELYSDIIKHSTAKQRILCRYLTDPEGTSPKINRQHPGNIHLPDPSKYTPWSVSRMARIELVTIGPLRWGDRYFGKEPHRTSRLG